MGSPYAKKERRKVWEDGFGRDKRMSNRADWMDEKHLVVDEEEYKKNPDAFLELPTVDGKTIYMRKEFVILDDPTDSYLAETKAKLGFNF